MSVLQPPVVLRPATLHDADQLLEWRNHPSVREMSRNPDVVEREQHVRWLERVLVDPDVILFVALDSERRPCGMARADRSDHDVEVSVTVDPAFRGRGLGSAMMLALEEQILESWPQARTLVAVTLAGNAASQRLFENVGYRPDHVTLKKAVSRESRGA